MSYVNSPIAGKEFGKRLLGFAHIEFYLLLINSIFSSGLTKNQRIAIIAF